MARGKGSGDRDTRDASLSVKEIVELAARHNLAELEVESGGTRIRVVREHAPAPTTPRHEPAPVQHVVGHIAPTEVSTAGTGLVSIEAPMVGTFYRASAPDAAPFANEGDVIKEGQVLCVIEAMKLMNEIDAKVAGRIAKVLVENGQPVEYGQPLFLVEPRR
jgi:acetyl-CoA carboxylase biotin carboxyl carrier protein